MSLETDFIKYRTAFRLVHNVPANDLKYWSQLDVTTKTQLIKLMKIKHKELKDDKYKDLRKREYPKFDEFMHEFFDGDIEKLRQKREAIKLKYPKPE